MTCMWEEAHMERIPLFELNCFNPSGFKGSRGIRSKCPSLFGFWLFLQSDA